VRNEGTVDTALEMAAISGEFSEYLANPVDARERLKIVARNMAICRKEAGMSQRDVCNLIGCAPQTYSGYEKGKHEPTTETLVRLAHLYNVTLDYLIGKNENDPVLSAMEDITNLDQNPTIQRMLERIERLEQQNYLK